MKMNHYIIKSEGGVDRVHFEAASLAGAVKDVMIYTKAGNQSVAWYVLSTARDLSVGLVVVGGMD